VQAFYLAADALHPSRLTYLIPPSTLA